MLFVALGWSGSASARVEGESLYTLAQTYSGALRYLRVDLGYEVTEKDPDAAYLLFRYSDAARAKRVTNGSIELVETDDRIRIFVHIPSMPGYYETMLRDGLLKKLKNEYGEPPGREPPPKKDRRENDPDAGSPKQKQKPRDPDGDERAPEETRHDDASARWS